MSLASELAAAATYPPASLASQMSYPLATLALLVPASPGPRLEASPAFPWEVFAGCP